MVFRGKMSTKTCRLVLIFASLNFILVPFQNCSAPINSAMLSEASSSVSSVSVPVEISFNENASLYNIKNMTQSFSVNAESESSIQSIQCQLDSQAMVDCSSKGISLTALSDGDHTLKVVVMQTNNLKTEVIKSFRIDTISPVINISQKPASTTNLNSASFMFNAADVLSGVLSTECSSNNSAFSICTSPYNLSALAQGSQSVKIKATDRAGNVSLVFSHSWVIDSTTPSVQLTAMPGVVTQSTAASFQFSGIGIVSYECSIDNLAFEACASPKVYSALAAGSRLFKVRGANASGIKSADVMFNWIVDNASPTAVQITSGFVNVGSNKSGQISFLSTDSLSGIKDYQCSLNNAAYAVCTSPRVITAIEGVNTFKVKAYDLAGNVSGEATASFTIDSVKPTLSFTQTPAASTTSTSAQFVFTSADANGSGIVSTQCSLDSAAFTNCTSPKDLSNLQQAAHKFSVQVKDQAGNTTTIEHNWTVNAVVTPPPPSPAVPMKTIFMGQGHGGRTLMSCDGGLSWINNRFDAGVDAGDHSVGAARGLDAGDGYFYANFGWGYNGPLRRSRDGINWEVIQTGHWGGGIAYGKDILFRYAEAGAWYNSTNQGQTWTDLTNAQLGIDGNQFDHPSVRRIGNKIFVVGRNQKMGVSHDQGKTWKLVSAGLLGNTEQRNFAEGNGIIVSFSYDYVNNTGNISRSTDNGLTWTGAVMGGMWSQPAFNGTHFVAWSQGKTWKSTDGLNWTNEVMKINGTNASAGWKAVTQYSPTTGSYVAILSGWQQEYANQKAFRSTDGVNWTTLDATKYEGGTSMKQIITGEIESKYCP